MTPPSELIGLKLREAIAVEVMGWAFRANNWSGQWFDASGEWRSVLPPWEYDRTAAQPVVRRMADLGLGREFAQMVRYILCPDAPDNVSDFALIEVDSKTIVRAALAVVREQRKDRTDARS